MIDEKYYENPNEFNPDRWNDKSPAGKDLLNQPYFAFGAGPRNCIAAGLGKVQVKVGLLHMLQTFKLKLGEELKNQELEIGPKVFSLTTVGCMDLKVTKR